MSLEFHRKRFYELTNDELYNILKVRSEVFVVEQNCVFLDLDGHDQESIHIWITDGDNIVAVSRICPAGVYLKKISIGRIITTIRGKGYGKAIMRYSIDTAQEYFNADEIEIEAQQYAKGFYEKTGFRQSSYDYIIDGIPHIRMIWRKEQ